MKNERFGSHYRNHSACVSDFQYDCGRQPQFEERWFRIDGENDKNVRGAVTEK